MTAPIVTLTGNPRPRSRTQLLARTLGAEISAALGGGPARDIDLASFGPRVLDPGDTEVSAAVDAVLGARILVAASPTYKATYSGLLKCFLDRLGTASLAGTAAVPVLLGGSQNHRLAVDVHFTPLLAELGAAVPVRGLFVLESELPGFPAFAAAWARAHAAALDAAAARAAAEPLLTPLTR